MSLKDEISKIPGDDGWWKSSSEDAYIKLAAQLVAKGFSEDEAVEILHSAYSYAKDCFGG